MRKPCDCTLMEIIRAQLFLFFAHDDYTKMYRKMLTIEQFHNPALAAEFSRQYYDEAIAYQKKLFGVLAEKGNFIEADYEVMAVHFYGPIYTLITASGEHCVLLHFHRRVYVSK